LKDKSGEVSGEEGSEVDSDIVLDRTELFVSCPALTEEFPNPIRRAAVIRGMGISTFLLGYFDLDDMEIITCW
jgi:hypothetical protein